MIIGIILKSTENAVFALVTVADKAVSSALFLQCCFFSLLPYTFPTPSLHLLYTISSLSSSLNPSVFALFISFDSVFHYTLLSVPIPPTLVFPFWYVLKHFSCFLCVFLCLSLSLSVSLSLFLAFQCVSLCLLLSKTLSLSLSVCLSLETHYENVNLQKEQKGRAELIIPRYHELVPKQEEKKVSFFLCWWIFVFMLHLDK